MSDPRKCFPVENSLGRGGASRSERFGAVPNIVCFESFDEVGGLPIGAVGDKAKSVMHCCVGTEPYDEGVTLKFPGAVASLTTAVAMGVAVFFTLYSLIPVTRAEDPGLSSLFLGTMMAFVMGVQIFTPAMVRRLSLRYVIIVSLILLATGAIITGWAPGTLPLIIGAVASGSGFGVLIVAGAQGIALLVTADKLGRALGTYGLITMAAAAVGSPIGVQIALTFSPTVFGICAFAVGLLATGLAMGVPSTVGRPRRDPPGPESPAATSATAQGSSKPQGVRALVIGAPWLVLVFLLVAVMLLSHGLSSLPVLAAEFGNAAVVIFAVQTGNAVGRSIGGELEARAATAATVITGAVLLAAGGTLGVLVTGSAAIIAAGALIGLGVGIIQTVTLHTAMRRMDAGHASVVWNLAVDGGLWAGGVLWGLALTSGLVGASALICSAVLLVLGATVVIRLRRSVRPRGAGSPPMSEAQNQRLRSSGPL